jgi:hypothetical protein
MSLGLGNHSNNFSVNTAYMCFCSLRNCAHDPMLMMQRIMNRQSLEIWKFLNTDLLLKPLTDGFPSHSSSQKSSHTLLSFYRPCNNLTLSGSMLISMLPSIFLQPYAMRVEWASEQPFDMSNEHDSFKISSCMEVLLPSFTLNVAYDDMLCLS